jgi:hypothetical protein
MIIVARRDEGDRAFVLTLLRVRVKALMQARRRRKRHDKKKCAEQSACNDAAANPKTFDDGLAAHVSGLWFVRANSQGKFFRPNERHSIHNSLFDAAVRRFIISG